LAEEKSTQTTYWLTAKDIKERGGEQNVKIETNKEIIEGREKHEKKKHRKKFREKETMK
jgi:hypothetical protein